MTKSESMRLRESNLKAAVTKDKVDVKKVSKKANVVDVLSNMYNVDTQTTLGISEITVTPRKDKNTMNTLYTISQNIPDRLQNNKDVNNETTFESFDYEEFVKKELAALSVEAIRDILEDPDVPANVRISAARYVLDRVLGTPVQKTQVTQTTQNMVLVIGQDISKDITKDFIDSQGIIRAISG